MHSFLEDLDGPRQKAVQAMRDCVPQDLRRQNAEFLQSLRDKISSHPVFRHPTIAALNGGRLHIEAMKSIHLEYRHAIVQIFTDALLAAQSETRQLEPRLHPDAKLAPRFLYTPNDLDEFGFRPGCDSEGYCQGNPAYAHYPQFERVIDDYGIEAQERGDYVPSRAADMVRRFLMNSYGNYLDVLALLAVAEEELIPFSPPLRTATGAVGIDVSKGYYFVHGVAGDESSDAADDDHQNDLWLLLTQALTPDQYPRISALCEQYCELWERFWALQLASASHPDLAPPVIA